MQSVYDTAPQADLRVPKIMKAWVLTEPDQLELVEKAIPRLEQQKFWFLHRRGGDLRDRSRNNPLRNSGPHRWRTAFQ